MRPGREVAMACASKRRRLDGPSTHAVAIGRMEVVAQQLNRRRKEECEPSDIFAQDIRNMYPGVIRFTHSRVILNKSFASHSQVIRKSFASHSPTPKTMTSDDGDVSDEVSQHDETTRHQGPSIYQLLTQMHKRNTRLEAALHRQHDEHAASESRVPGLQAALATSDGRCKDLKAALAASRHRELDLEANVSSELGGLVDVWRCRCDEADAREAELKANVSRLEGIISSKRAVEEAAAGCNELKAALAASRHRELELEASVSRLGGLVDVWRCRCDEADAREAELKANVSRLQEEEDAARSVADLHQADVGRLTARCEALEVECERRQAAVSAAAL